MPNNDVNINVNIDPNVISNGVTPNTNKNNGLKASTPYVSKETLKKLAFVASGAAFLGRVASYGVDQIGEVTGNEELERRLKDDLNSFKKLINPAEVGREIIAFTISIKNQESRIRLQTQFNGTLTNGGR